MNCWMWCVAATTRPDVARNVLRDIVLAPVCIGLACSDRVLNDLYTKQTFAFLGTVFILLLLIDQGLWFLHAGDLALPSELASCCCSALPR